MKRLTWGRGGALLAALALVGVAGCGNEGGEVDGISLVQADKLTVCTHLPYKPFQFERDGEVVGFEKDILDLLANDLGVEQEVVNLGAWEQVTSGKAFDNEACDIGMGAMTITPERDKVLEITEPYFEADQVLVAKKGAGIDSLDGLSNDKIGVQTDTTGQHYVSEQGLDPRRFDDLALQMNALKAGEIEAAVNDNGPVLDWLGNNPDYEVTKVFQTNESYGFPARDDANGKKLIDRLEKVISKAKEDGTYTELHREWFGVAPGESLTS